MRKGIKKKTKDLVSTRSGFELLPSNLPLPTETHPVTHEPLVRCKEITRTTNYEEFRVLPPRPPTYEIWRYDDDGLPHLVRKMHEKEYQKARAAYARAVERWQRDQGIKRVYAGDDITATFKTVTGSEVEGLWVGSLRRWAYKNCRIQIEAKP